MLCSHVANAKEMMDLRQLKWQQLVTGCQSQAETHGKNT